MRFRLTLAASFTAIALLGVTAGHADIETFHVAYDVGGAYVDGVAFLGAQGNVGTTAVHIGSAIFEANSMRPRSVKVVDSSGTPVRYMACQDRDNDAFCDTGEPTVTGCSPAAKSISTWPSGRTILVLVASADTKGECVGVGSGGTISVSYTTI